MNLPPAFQERHKELLLKTLEDTIQFFERHDLRYTAAFGTVLGAVRHKGFIPWDDDIDLFMPREDYNKLLGMNSELNALGYEVVSPHDAGYYLYFAKVVNRRTTLLESADRPFPLGVFVDIFPLDASHLPNDQLLQMKNEGQRLYSRYARTTTRVGWAKIFGRLLRCRTAGIRAALSGHLPQAAKQKIHADLLAFERQHAGTQGNKLVRWFCYDSLIYPKEWFSKTVTVPFEHLAIRIPSQYDAYLRMEYGDYMQLPPEEKRVTHHSIAYYNLKERLTLDEVKERIARGETLVY